MDEQMRREERRNIWRQQVIATSVLLTCAGVILPAMTYVAAREGERDIAGAFLLLLSAVLLGCIRNLRTLYRGKSKA